MLKDIFIVYIAVRSSFQLMWSVFQLHSISTALYNFAKHFTSQCILNVYSTTITVHL